ncbi:MAG: helix-turn-helix domain-containing protein [Proteobacteria bacterium]|nr:helix-turn-helix domain-containing protein [Pseudomonadota bacterium]
MTKRSSVRARQEENQADLFGAAPPPSPKKARAAKTAPTAGPTPRSNQAKQSTPDALLNVRQAAARLGLSKSTLDKMRRAHKGPRFVKTTDRAIRYDPVDLDRWINARRSQSE